MTYIKNHILQNNAIEAWAMAIRYCDYILEGKATLEYRKHFVSVLHNSVELFIKQLMLNNTDYRVTQMRINLPCMGKKQNEFPPKIKFVRYSSPGSELEYSKIPAKPVKYIVPAI